MSLFSLPFRNKKKDAPKTVEEIDPTELTSDAMLLIINSCNKAVDDNLNDSDLGKAVRKIFTDLHTRV